MGKDKKQTQTTTVDPASQGHIDAMRRAGIAGAGALGGPLVAGADQRSIAEQIAPFMNPFTQQVIAGLGSHFDRRRAQASTGASQGATAAGAFGGSRHGVLEAERLAALDRAQMEQVGGLLTQQFDKAVEQGREHSEYLRALRERQMQEPYMRAIMQQQLLGGSLGPTGTTQTKTEYGNLLGDIAGLGLMGAGMFMGGPTGTTAAQRLTSAANNPAFTAPLFPGGGSGVGFRPRQPGAHPWYGG